MLKKTKRLVVLLLLTMLTLLLSGCMAFDVALTVNEDWSGKLVYDVLWLPEAGENSPESVPDGTEYIKTLNLDGKEYTGYRVTRPFHDKEELKSILLEKAGTGELPVSETQDSSILKEASAFKIGNFISDVSILSDENTKTCSMDITFLPMDLSSFAGVTNENGERVEVPNSEIFKIRMNIDLPGTTTSAVSNSFVDIENLGDRAVFTLSPDKTEHIKISIASDFSNNTYVYSDTPTPQASYTYTGNSEANHALDEQTAQMNQIQKERQISADKLKSDHSDLLIPYIIGAIIFLIILAGVCVLKIKLPKRDDAAYERKLKRDEENEKRRKYK